MKKFYSYTENLRTHLDTCTKEQFMIIHNAIDFYIDQYNNLLKSYDGMTIVYNFMGDVNKLLEKGIQESGRKMSCHKGCSFCCQINVDITEDEADLLLMYVSSEKIDVDVERLERQSKADNWLLQNATDRKCVFLGDDGACTVYEARPMNCRRHLVVTEPEKCDAIGNPKGEIGKLSVLEAEVITTAIMSTRKTDSMPKMLLEKLKNHEKAV